MEKERKLQTEKEGGEAKVKVWEQVKGVEGVEQLEGTEQPNNRK